MLSDRSDPTDTTQPYIPPRIGVPGPGMATIGAPAQAQPVVANAGVVQPTATQAPGQYGGMAPPPAPVVTPPQGQGLTPQNHMGDRDLFAAAGLNLDAILSSIGGADTYAQLKPKLAAAMQGGSSTDVSNQYYSKDSGGGAWMVDPTSPSGYKYGSLTPTGGIDQRAWSNINNTNAYEYGGQVGGAATEVSRYAGMGQAAGSAAAPTMNLADYNALKTGMGAGANAAGADAMSMTRAAALGQTPSVANAQMEAGIASAARSQFQQAASARGGGANLVAASQLASSAAGNTQANAVTQAGVQAAQERLNAQNAYASQANAQQNAYAQQAGLAGTLAYQQAGLQQGQNQLNQQGQLAYETMRQGVFNAQQSAQMQGEAQNANTGMTAAQMQATKDANDKALQRQVIGGVLTAAGTVGGAAIGGPAGAAAGGMAGRAAAGAV